MLKEISNVNLIGIVDPNLVENFPDDGTNFSLIFVESGYDISIPRQSQKLPLRKTSETQLHILKTSSLFLKKGRDTVAKYTQSAVHVTTRSSTNCCTRKKIWFGYYSIDVVC